MKKERGNLIVSGSGGASGGPFDKVVINGHGRVDGDLVRSTSIPSTR